MQHTTTPNLNKLYQQYLQNPQSVPFAWQVFFARQDGKGEPVAPAVAPSVGQSVAATAQNNVSHMVQSFRSHGHTSAHINPLEPAPDLAADLQLSYFGLDESMMNQTFATDGVLPATHAPLKDILSALKQTYTGSIGVQYNHMSNHGERQWLREKMEKVHNRPTFSAAQQATIAHALMKAEKFENFLHTKYVGVKRFSAEGAEAVVPMLETIVQLCGENGVSDVVMGMAHRARMNVLANIMHKPFVEIFAAFNDALEMEDDAVSASDVKYHMGKSYDVTTPSGKVVHISLQNNPSHLEMVNPVVAGSARARQQRYGKEGIHKVLPVAIHGDSAFAGQGVVAETLNMANLKGYSVGGTVHVVINNQVGFTAEPAETFSGEYCTDVARMLQAPIFHVNGDDAEACVWVAQMAMEYRTRFNKDVVIDLVCYRKYGHNEGDDPTFTQPLMYQKIKNHPSPYTQYKAKVEQQVGSQVLAKFESDYDTEMAAAFDTARNHPVKVRPDMFGGAWQGLSCQNDEPKTAVSVKALHAVADAVSRFPENFTPNSKVQKTLEKRTEMLKGESPMDWGSAEVAAYGTLLQEGVSVRLSGQDVQRGTFSHRHIVNVDADTGERVAPLAAVAAKGARLEAHNSPLSELAVMGFEFGHSLADPTCLPVWEAQFGDFVNGAQVMLDQFVASSESKWHRLSGLTLLLPHGMEGMGSEHSSARLERFLQLCAHGNMTVLNPTTPAQIFHALRRQMLRKTRRPLVVMSPKSLLRHPLATSTVEDLTKGAFEQVIADDAAIMQNARKVVLCSGKVYYDLLAHRTANKNTSVAIIRLEQLYPVPLEQVQKLLASCKKAKQFVWVQEEVRNQGAWSFLLDTLFTDLPQKFSYVGRAACPSPAVGSPKRHKAEQQAIVDEAFS